MGCGLRFRAESMGCGLGSRAESMGPLGCLFMIMRCMYQICYLLYQGRFIWLYNLRPSGIYPHKPLITIRWYIWHINQLNMVYVVLLLIMWSVANQNADNAYLQYILTYWAFWTSCDMYYGVITCNKPLAPIYFEFKKMTSCERKRCRPMTWLLAVLAIEIGVPIECWFHWSCANRLANRRLPILQRV